MLTQLLADVGAALPSLTFVRATPSQAHNLGCQKHDALYKHPSVASVAIHYVKKPAGMSYLRRVLDGVTTFAGKPCTRDAGVG